MTSQHLAQINISRLLAPLDSEQLSGFVSQLESINALAESTEGFVWRLKVEGGQNATDFRPFDDDMIIVNMSVWADGESLKNYVFKSAHSQVMRNRAAWFEKPTNITTVLWYVEAGHLPTLEEAKERLAHINEHGETDYAFSFKRLMKP